jgi:hypothetical protein
MSGDDCEAKLREHEERIRELERRYTLTVECYAAARAYLGVRDRVREGILTQHQLELSDRTLQDAVETARKYLDSHEPYQQLEQGD